MKRFSAFLFIFILAGCQLILRPVSGNGEFNFQFPASCINDSSETVFVSFTYASTDGIEILYSSSLDLTRSGDNYTSAALDVPIGDYEIYEISIINTEDNILALSPKTGSNKATDISKPLPYEFSVEKNKTTYILPDMLPLSAEDGLSDFGYSTQEQDMTALYPTFSASLNDFSFDLLREVSNNSDTGNVFLSPMSVAYAFGLLYPAARGTALEEIRELFYLEDYSDMDVYLLYRDFMTYILDLDENVEINLAHAVWYRSGWIPLPSYTSTVNRYFDCVVSELDFENSQAAADTINSWASRNTHEKIQDIVGPDDIINAVAILGNATYLKAGWLFDFDSTFTESNVFTCSDGDTVNVEMMSHGTHITCKTYINNDYQLIRLPLEAYDGFEITFLMPFNESPEELLQNLSAGEWSALMDSSQMSQIHLTLPKFKDKLKYRLKTDLQNLGMNCIFTSPDLSGMFSSDGLYVSDVIHDTYISVDESGVEAAAVTIIPIDIGIHPGIIPISFNQPFIYTIQDSQTHAILFIGLSRAPKY